MGINSLKGNENELEIRINKFRILSQKNDEIINEMKFELDKNYETIRILQNGVSAKEKEVTQLENDLKNREEMFNNLRTKEERLNALENELTNKSQDISEKMT